MGDIAEQLKARTMRFSLDVCALIQHLPAGEPGWTVQHQLAKAATSVAFNYRAACRGRSHAEYTAKIGVVSEESDESLGWLEFIKAGRLLASEELSRLLAEAEELSKIMSTSYGTARYNERNKRDKKNRRYEEGE
jgi:four helix bundle protein